jgi:hypothetical protein
MLAGFFVKLLRSPRGLYIKRYIFYSEFSRLCGL